MQGFWLCQKKVQMKTIHTIPHSQSESFNLGSPYYRNWGIAGIAHPLFDLLIHFNSSAETFA